MHKPEDRSFIGHPRDLSYIAFRAAWERFSSFGMQSLLVLYMVHRLLYPGHIERIAGSATKVSIGWLVTFHVLNSIGFADIFPVSLALYARVAPAALSATIIGTYYLASFAANNVVGTIGGPSRKDLPSTHFWCSNRPYAAVLESFFSLPVASLAIFSRRRVMRNHETHDWEVRDSWLLDVGR